jgi:hypothetical protein
MKDQAFGKKIRISQWCASVYEESVTSGTFVSESSWDALQEELTL